MRSFGNSKFRKYIIGGILNTLITYLVYIFLLIFFSYLIAFTASFFSGIIFSYFINSRLVFEQKLYLKGAIVYPMVYLFYYILNIGFLYVFIEVASLPEEVGPILVLPIVVPIMFLINKKLFLSGFR